MITKEKVIEKIENGFRLRPSDYTDIGEAQKAKSFYKNELIYTPGAGFLRFNGSVWEGLEDDGIGAIEIFVQKQLEEAKDTCSALSEGVNEIKRERIDLDVGAMRRIQESIESAKLYLSFAKKCNDLPKIKAIKGALVPMIMKADADLDGAPMLLNTPDFTVNLSTGKAGGHNPLDYMTKTTAVTPGYNGKEIWEDALNVFFCSDKELIEYVQTVMGMAIIGKVYVEGMIIAYGTGRNGKSTFFNSIAKVLGSYATYLSSDTLLSSAKYNVRPEIAELKGKRLAIAGELSEGKALDVGKVKQICSVDPVTAEKKYKTPFDFVPSHMVVLYTNHLPKVSSLDKGTWRRLKVVPFKAVIDGGTDIKNYTEYLVEEAGEYILTWLIEGAKRAISLGYHIPEPEAVRVATSSYRADNNWLNHFVEECCIVGEGYSVKASILYNTYKTFSEENGEVYKTSADFKNALIQSGFGHTKKRDGNYYAGLTTK